MRAPGVILEAVLDSRHADAELAAWSERLAEITAALGWRVQSAVRRDGTWAALAFTAPIDALFTATVVNEWAWIGAATDGARRAVSTLAADEIQLPAALPAALERLREMLAEEANPALVALAERASSEHVPFFADEEQVTVGYGAKSKSWPPRDLPRAHDVAWSALGEIPVALVTGSNGKTTTVRLIAAMLARAGHTVGFCCSDGVGVGGEMLETGDWSGPAGAKRVLREPRVTAAVLESARGGLLRRGLALPRAQAAIVTNIAEDHFGEYGIRTRADLARVKLTVAGVLGASGRAAPGTLVLNGDDPALLGAAPGHGGSVEWFSTATPSAGLPAAAEMPITLDGAAAYNYANALGAAAVARALGVAPAEIADTLRTFGADNADNPGRLERFTVRGVRVWVDYAHNPHGLAALLAAARRDLEANDAGRLGLLLGQAGDREDEAIRALARTAWTATPDRIVLKDLDGYLRGRTAGEVPTLLRDELLRAGASEAQLEHAADEEDGVRILLAWARPGDLLVLPVHALGARARTVELLAQP